MVITAIWLSFQNQIICHFLLILYFQIPIHLLPFSGTMKENSIGLFLLFSSLQRLNSTEVVLGQPRLLASTRPTHSEDKASGQAKQQRHFTSPSDCKLFSFAWHAPSAWSFIFLELQSIFLSLFWNMWLFGKEGFSLKVVHYIPM